MKKFKKKSMNISQSIECGCRWNVALPFSGLHSTRVSPQKAMLGSAHVYEP